MIGYCVLLAALVLLFLLLSMPLGVLIQYDNALKVIIKIGIFPVTIYPNEEKNTQQKNGTQQKLSPPKEHPKTEKRTQNKQLQKPTVEQVLYLFKNVPHLLSKTLKGLVRRITIKPLHLTLLYGEEDPADAAIHFGEIYGGIAVSVETLEQLLTIKEKKLELALDFDRESPDICGEIGISMRVYALLCLALSLAADGWKLYKGYQKLALSKKG